ncbi:hypothetical protein [Flavobacterium sp.]|uniref:hypothetical protein n=1 Tax=Flavobacterium sp. TaxID=239 RepID=UPI0040479C55
MRKLSIIVFTLLSYYCSAQEKKCGDFKIGKFKYANPEQAEWKITRTDTTQVEISTKTQIELHASVKWISDCQYTLTYKEIINSTVKEVINKTILFEIIATKNNHYVCTSKSYGIEMQLEMIKIE